MDEDTRSFPTGPPTHEVQSCNDRCDFPCTKARPCTWDPCHILRSHHGGKEYDVLIENEVYYSIRSRHVRPITTNATGDAGGAHSGVKRRRGKA